MLYKSKNTQQEIWWLTLLCTTRKCHFCFFFSPPQQPRKNPSHHWEENFKLHMRELLILLQVHSRLTPICKDELKNWRREGEWLFVTCHPPTPPPADSLTLFSCSLPSCSLLRSIIPPPQTTNLLPAGMCVLSLISSVIAPPLPHEKHYVYTKCCSLVCLY